MLLKLSVYHSKKIAFFLGYMFFISGLCSFVYGRDMVSVSATRSVLTYSAVSYNEKKPAISAVKKVRSGINTGNPPVKKSIYAEKANQSPAGKKHLDIGGPSQPEMSAFKPVGADNLVDPFTGDFSYNIPLLDVGGYPVNIFYNSGITMDQEASWVGLGWNINPGTIMRNMRGLPDDFNGTEIVSKEQYSRPDQTWGVSVGGSVEVFGGPISFGVGLNGGVFYNNMRGLGLEAGVRPAIGIGSKSGDEKTAPISFGWKLSGNSQTGGSSTFSISLRDNNKRGLDGSLTASIGTHSRQGLQALHLDAEFSNSYKFEKTQASVANGDAEIRPSLGTSISFAYPSFMPSMRSRVSSLNFDLDLGLGGSLAPVFPHARLGGYYTKKWISEDDIKIEQPAYGMMYFKQGQENDKALMDFNRINDGMYSPSTPAIAVPVYTYDVYSISGEGTGGSFRAYRGDLGYVKDATVESDGFSGHLGIDLGAGNYGHGGFNVRTVITPSNSGEWKNGNPARNNLRFIESNKDTQAVYFKNPGEKAIPDKEYQDAICGEDLVRLKMINTAPGSSMTTPYFVRYSDMLKMEGELQVNTATTKKKRDKRTQVISFLTAEEADRVGLNRRIEYIDYNELTDSSKIIFGCKNDTRKKMRRFDYDISQSNTIIRRKHHISEINVLMPDGRKYVYDIPVYNIKQTDVTFNLPGSGNGNGTNNYLSQYEAGIDNTAMANKKGKDFFVEKQHTPPYAHSYLLTALLSPNYVDVKGDGITDDDMGDAIKFNYLKSKNNIRWRTPNDLSKATLSEGLKTDKNDDKAHYIFGEREQWYLYSIESKNMVARFYIKSDRKDSRSVQDEDGGINTSLGTGACYLAKISLFTKGELLKRPNNPRPIKTVHFRYDYSLCSNVSHNSGMAEIVNGVNINQAKGKLTLKEIYFTYNGNNKGKKNSYRFYYPDDNLGNPAYSYTANDRWGNYKPDDESQNGNPGGLNNADFPYTSKEIQKANDYSKAWTLNRISLPSGATINIDYEADDYAFVQDRRSTQMFSIIGFGDSNNPTEFSNKLYQNTSSTNDYIYVFVPRAITETDQAKIKNQIQEWYVGNYAKSKQIFMKLAVNMPTDKNGSGFELVPVYAELEDFGLIPNTGGQKIWLKVRKLLSNYTPMVHYSLQYLKSNLPSKAYPGYDVSEEGGIKAVVKAVAGLYSSFREVFTRGMKLMMQDGKCKTTVLGKSFIRLTDPYLKKPGGGLRVKKVVITDNWDKMTNTALVGQPSNGMDKATYGQEYFYTKQEFVNGEMMTISSGVASWEPAMGAEENPHRQAIEYYNKNPKADYDYQVMETPVPEMLYPSASVGYSRVEVRSIHRDTVKNAPGISVTEFYTSREFPTTSSFTPLTEYNAKDIYESGSLDKFLKSNLKTSVALTQGFKVDLNDMNGKMKKQATYSPDNLRDPISYTENFYSIVKTGANSFKLNHNFPVIKSPDGKVEQSIIGREVELMTDFREHNQQTITTNIDINVDVINGALIPIPVPTTWKPVVRESNIYRSAAMLKVVNHYSMLDSVVAVDKGSMVSTKNLVFDAETGDPLLTRTNNEHNQPVYSFSYPAHWAYSGMGLAYKNIDAIFKNVTFRNGKLDATSGVNTSLLESGDEIYVDASRSGWLPVVGFSVCEPAIMPATPATKIWAVNTGKAGSATPQWVFMDANGNPFTASGVDIRIIRSGKRNMFSAGLGSIVSLVNPINPSTDKLEFNDSKNIIQTTAASYKDHWRVDDIPYVKDSIVRTTVWARIKRMDFKPEDFINATYYKYGSGAPIFSTSKNDYLLQYLKHVKPGTWNHSEVKFGRSFVLFNLSNVPSNAVSYKSFLSIYSHVSGLGNANHPPIHGTNKSHTQLPDGTLGMVKVMKSGWYPLNEANTWGNTYLNTPWNASLEYTPILGSVSGDENYTINNGRQLDVTMRFAEGTGAPLWQSKRVGFQLSLPYDDNYPDRDRAFNFRCFWAKQNNKYFTDPMLTFYYFICGDTSYSYGDPKDPYLDKLHKCYSYNTLTSFCLSKFTQRKSVNPYVEGIWGNWRVDTAFVYYGNRKENAIVDGAPVDTRTGGAIIGYKSFWNFALASTGLLTRNYSAADVWTYSSTITQYNRKGYEVENKDPLDRYNAGLYGYDQQLPVAVINNSRYAESLFDGFEDYDYQSNLCAETCKPRRRVDMGNIQNYLSGEQKHSGKQSLKVNANQAYSFSAPVVSTGNLNGLYSMRVKMDSTAYTDTTVVSSGTGFSGKYYNYYCGNGWGYPNLDGLTNPIVRNGETINLQCNSNSKECNGGPNYDCVSGRPPYGINNNFFAARWEGYIQPVVSGKHYFRTLADDGIRVTVNGMTVINRWTEGFAELNSEAVPVTLLKGQVYQIRIDYFEAKQNARAVLLWRHPGMTGYDLLPSRVIYASAAAASGTTSIATSWCTKLDSVNVRGNALTDTFSLIQSKQMLVSAWVKVGGNDCKCSTYVNNKIRITYTGSSEVTEFTPAGSIIEGWQRYEGVFVVPNTATKINVQLVNNNTSPAWFDDLRIHPFNANMKSFVYNPQSLRLMSELDENNYASFYEYDDEGTLTRVKKETVKGIKTITETRSHLQKAIQ